MHITLHITNRCNMDCAYCYSEKGTDDMSFDTAMEAVSRCASGPNCGVIFFGGEPLLMSDLIWQVIESCDSAEPGRFHYKVTTNGTLITEQFLDDADRHSLHIAMSHDGIRDAHDMFRKDVSGTGSFERVLPNLRLLLRRRPYSPIMLTVNPETVHLYTESVKWLQSIGARYLVCSLNYAGAWTQSTLKKLKREYLKLEDWHFDNYTNERKVYFSPFDKRIATHVFDDRDNSCRLGKRQISVGPDGRFYPCVQFVGRSEYCIGSSNKGIDKEKREQIYAQNEQDKETCINCALSRRCHNKCGCLNIQTTGNISHIPPILCEHERMIFPIADRLAERLFRKRNPMFIHRHYNQAFPFLSFIEDLVAG